MNRKYSAVSALLAALLICSGCSVLPRQKTVELKRPLATATSGPADNQMSFEIEKIYTPQLGKLDSVGYSSTPRNLVLGWSDRDTLLGIQVLERNSPAGEDLSALKQEADRLGVDLSGIKTDSSYELSLVSMDYRYSFLETICSIPENYMFLSVSHDGTMLAMTFYNDAGFPTLQVCSTVTGELLYSGSISVSYEGGLHWSNNDRFVCLASSDPNAFILLLEVETGQMDSVFSHSELDGLLKDSYLSQIEYVDDIRQQVVLRVESKAEGTYLVRFDFWSDGSGSPQTIPDYYSQNGDTQWQYLDGQTGLALVDNTLMQADLTEGATAVKVASNVSAFALSKDRKYIAYIQGDAYTTSDLYIARYLNGSLINTRMVYKGLSSDGTLMSFSPDNHQLILNVQRRSSASTSRQTMVLEFQ